MPVALVNALPSGARPSSPSVGEKELMACRSLAHKSPEPRVHSPSPPPPLSSMLRQSQPELKSMPLLSPGTDRDTRNLPKVGDRFKGGKLSTGYKRGEAGSKRGTHLVGSVELPDIRDSITGKPHREPPKVVKEAAMEAEDVARQLREAGLVAEAAALERLRCDLMAPGADLTAKKNEARVLAEKLRAQAKEKAHSRRFARQQSGQTMGKGSTLITITGRQCMGNRDPAYHML